VVEQQTSGLSRLALAAYGLLVVYASLYPFSGWRGSGDSLLSFLGAGWPRYVTTFDVVANVLAYLPIGALLAAVLGLRRFGTAGRLGGLLAIVALGTLLSLCLEALQSLLPSRTPSNLDVVCNAVGTAIGALAGAFVPLPSGRWRAVLSIRAWRYRGGTATDLGLLLVLLWLFSQLNPSTPLFSGGDLRDLVSSWLDMQASPEGPAREPREFTAVEALLSGSFGSAFLLLFSALTRSDRLLRVEMAGLVFLALLVKTAALAIVMRAENVFAWATPGTILGVAGGAGFALAAAGLPRGLRLALAATLLTVGVAIINFAPPNPYHEAILAVWRQGHFLNFNGLTRAVATLLPFAGIAVAVMLALDRGEIEGSEK
jgi:VanZ family protein